ncbi:MAG: metallophosphoesterase [Chthoniobacter sp.]|nr:metallophosphoesterase [Chthoniobacter sp.]
MSLLPIKPASTRPFGNRRFRWLALTALLALVTMSASAQIAFDAASSGAVNSNAVLSWSHTVGAGSNRMLVVGISTERGTTTAHASAATVTLGVQGMTRVTGSFANSSDLQYVSTELWYLPNPTVGTGTITVTFSDSPSGGIMGGAVSLTGVAQAAPEAVVAAGGTDLTVNYSATLTTLTNGAWLVDIAGSASSTNDFTPGSGMTSRWAQKLVNSASMSQAGATRPVAVAGAVTDTWTGTVSNRKSQSVAAFAPAVINLPPTVTLTAPTGAYSGTAPATVNFAANASDNDGTVTKVEFFQGATKVGEDTTAPYTYAWTGVPAGTYSLTARATDNLGATTISSPAVSITVTLDPNAPIIALTSPAANTTDLGTSTNLQVAVSDGTIPAEPLTVTFYGRKTTPATPGPDFTLMTIPDTQFYSENTGRLGGAFTTIFNAQTQWMVDNRVTRNIAFVSHMGDIVQNGDFGGVTTEWDNADGAMKLIENPLTTLRAFGIPWGAAPGNHDYGPAGGGSGTTTFFNSYFGTARFTGRNYYGGNYGTNNNNNYQLFSASGLDFIAIHLEYQSTGTTPQAILDWANALLQAYPNRRGIVTSHNTLNTGNPGTFSAQGAGIYNALKGNKNLFLMLGGHVTGEGRRTEVFNGHTVYASLQDYQDLTNGGNGFLRIFTFSPANNNIVTETWSPTLNRAATTTDHASALGTYTLAWTSPDVSPLQGSLTDWIPLGTVNVAAGGTSASLPWTGLEKDGHYEWFASVSDGVSTVSSTSRRFSTSANLAPTVTLTAPANNTVLAAPAAFTLTATASDADGIARVEFYQGQTKLGEDTTAPYELAVAGLAAGNYDYLAVAVDNTGTPTNPNPTNNTTNASSVAKATRSAVVNVRVTSGSPPSVSLTAPTTGSLGSTISFSATASDPGGSVTKVEFFRDYTKLGEDTTAPYDFSWSGFAAGSYSLTAKATDNSGNVTQSAPVVIEVANTTLVTRGPYLQSASPTQMVVRWRTTANTPGRARYGTDAGNLIDYVNSTVTAAPSPATGFDHVALITGLTPNTTYYYTIGTAANLLTGGPTYTFTTPPTAGTVSDTRIWVLGDAGTSGNAASPTVAQTSVRDAFYTWTGTRTPNLVLQLGDNAYNTGTDAEFQKGVFDIYPTMLRRTPFWSCLGNHETGQATAFVDTYPYFSIYSFPIAGECGGVASGSEHYYSFDYGNIHFICLDSMTANRNTIEVNGSDGPMAAWLRTDLASTTATWIVCYFHHPPYTKGSHNSDTESELIQIRTNFLPILENGGVDLVLTGHSHCYERSMLIDRYYGLSTNPGVNAVTKNATSGRPAPAGPGAYVKPLTGPRDHFGAVYSVTGSAGQATSWTGGSTALINPTPHPVMFTSLLRLGSLVLDINGTRLDASFINNTGAIEDSFTIIKQGAADSDGDGIPDAYEIANGLDRFSAADAALDSDGDGISNLKEFIFSTASNAATSRYVFSTAYNTPVIGQATVSFPTTTGRTYRVMYSANLLSWQSASSVVAGTGATMQWTDDGTTTGSLPSAEGKRFYRIEIAVVP